MQVNSIKNLTNNRSQNPAFGAIKLYSGADETLKKALKPENWKTFQTLAENQNRNTMVDIILFGRHNSKKLDGRLVPKESNMFTKIEDYKQGFFENAISFINKLCLKADKYAEKNAKIKDINPDEILSKLK